LGGNRRALSKSISYVENENTDASELLDRIYDRVGKAYRIGITGPPGAGKSTLVDQLTRHYRKQGKTVGIIAVDPTSPFTGGSLLGDRVRMSSVAMDEGVFIRSMATRGSLGGLSKKASDAADVLDAFGKDYVIFETVGVGQSELEIVEAADTTVVTLVPESGDSIQAMKAGLMEIADIFIVNKADREGADNAMRELDSMLQLRENRGWKVEVLATVASEGKGISEVGDKIAEHWKFMQEHGLLEKKRKQRLSKKVETIVRHRLEQAFWDDVNRRALLEQLESPHDSRLSPYKIAEQLIKNFKRKIGES